MIELAVAVVPVLLAHLLQSIRKQRAEKENQKAVLALLSELKAGHQDHEVRIQHLEAA